MVFHLNKRALQWRSALGIKAPINHDTTWYNPFLTSLWTSKQLPTFIWVNYKISLTGILRPFGDDFPKINHDSSEGEQWGRCNLPIEDLIGWTLMSTRTNGGFSSAGTAACPSTTVQTRVTKVSVCFTWTLWIHWQRTRSYPQVLA